MKVIGIIPARWGSRRLPGKSLISICGKPLIEWIVESAQRAESLDSLLVATDDERILETVEALGVKAAMTRPDHPSGTDRVAEAIGDMEADVVINIQGDELLLDPGLIDRLVRVMSEDEEWDMGTAAAPIKNSEDLHNPSIVKVAWDEKGRALYFSRSLIPFIRDRDSINGVAVHWRHLGIYAYRRSFLETLVQTPPCLLEQVEKLEQLRALYIGGKIVVLQTVDTGCGVDTPEDVKIAEQVIRQLHGT